MCLSRQIGKCLDTGVERSGLSAMVGRGVGGMKVVRVAVGECRE